MSKDKQREEWIEEKARELYERCICKESVRHTQYGRHQFTPKEAKDFIRTLLDEAPMRKPKVSKVVVEQYAKEIVERIFSREYVCGNSQTLKVLCRMLKKINVEVEK